MTDKPQKGDWVRVSYEAEVTDEHGYFSGRAANDANERRGKVRNQRVEVIERADDPRNDPPGTFRVTNTGNKAVKVRPNRWYLLDDIPGAPARFTDEMVSAWTRFDSRPRIRRAIEPNGDMWFELKPGLFTWTGSDSGSPKTAERYSGSFRDYTIDEMVRSRLIKDESDLTLSYVDDDR